MGLWVPRRAGVKFCPDVEDVVQSRSKSVRSWHGILLSAVVLAGLNVSTAWAVIQVLLPLQSLIKTSDLIVMAKVTKVDPDRPSAVIEVGETLKGKSPFQRLPINLTGDKEKHTPELLKRIAVDTPLVLCVQKQGEKQWMALAYTNGTWFQLIGERDGDQTRWAFTHCETYLRRTFKGTTDELRQTVVGVLDGTKKAPPPNPKEAPGFGPELKR